VKAVERIEIEGDAYERGRQYGARVAPAIRQNVRAYLRLVEFHAGLAPEAAWAAAETFGPILEAHAPDLLLEMRGIADGADCELLDVVLINARSELMGTMGECTALAAGPAATGRRQVLLGQNWDWFTAVEAEPVLLHIRGTRAGEPDILTLCEAGQVGKIGLNSAGLGVCLNFMSHADRGQGVPVHVILRQMLGCAHLGDAIREVYRVPRGGAANVLLAHAQGEILDLELTPRSVDFLYAKGDRLVHANHFESAHLRGGDTGLATSRSTLARAARARRLLADAAGGVSLDTYHAILSDHAHGPYAICRHADENEPILQQSATRASAVMDLSTRTMYLTSGQPCRQDYEAITFKHAGG
jgi:isopenicillin-N N-acyltransferase-like protein